MGSNCAVQITFQHKCEALTTGAGCFCVRSSKALPGCSIHVVLVVIVVVVRVWVFAAAGLPEVVFMLSNHFHVQ